MPYIYFKDGGKLLINQTYRFLLIEGQLLMEVLDGKVDVKVQAADQQEHEAMGGEAHC